MQNMLIFLHNTSVVPDSMRESNRTFDIYKYWRHVLGTSVASCMLSSRINKGDKYELFSYGLIHDIGIVVLDACLPNHIDRITEKLISGVHQLIAERIILGGITHAEIGAWLCKNGIYAKISSILWNFITPLLWQKQYRSGAPDLCGRRYQYPILRKNAGSKS